MLGERAELVCTPDAGIWIGEDTGIVGELRIIVMVTRRQRYMGAMVIRARR